MKAIPLLFLLFMVSSTHASPLSLWSEEDDVPPADHAFVDTTTGVSVHSRWYLPAGHNARHLPLEPHPAHSGAYAAEEPTDDWQTKLEEGIADLGGQLRRRDHDWEKALAEIADLKKQLKKRDDDWKKRLKAEVVSLQRQLRDQTEALRQLSSKVQVMRVLLAQAQAAADEAKAEASKATALSTLASEASHRQDEDLQRITQALDMESGVLHNDIRNLARTAGSHSQGIAALGSRLKKAEEALTGLPLLYALICKTVPYATVAQQRLLIPNAEARIEDPIRPPKREREEAPEEKDQRARGAEDTHARSVHRDDDTAPS